MNLESQYEIVIMTESIIMKIKNIGLFLTLNEFRMIN